MKLWLWRTGDREFVAYRHEYPVAPDGGDPLTLGEPSSLNVALKPSRGRGEPDASADHKARNNLFAWMDGAGRKYITNISDLVLLRRLLEAAEAERDTAMRDWQDAITQTISLLNERDSAVANGHKACDQRDRVLRVIEALRAYRDVPSGNWVAVWDALDTYEADKGK